MTEAPKVAVFEWQPGKNDAEYIKKLREALDEQHKLTGRAIAKLKEYARTRVEVVHCRDCQRRYDDECPMRFVESYYNEGWEEWDDIVHDRTIDGGFCDRGIAVTKNESGGT